MRRLCFPSEFLPKRTGGRVFRQTLASLCGAALAVALSGGCRSADSALALPKPGAPIPVGLKREPTAAEQAFWQQISPARVLYIPEVHTSNNDHEYQFDVMKGLKARNMPFVIGWEMFDETQQPLLDQWNSHQISTEELLEKTDWQRHWGVQSVLYEKMMRWSQGEGVTSLALNAPQTLSHKTATGGEFSPEERALLPSGFRALPGGYEHFAEQMNQNPHGGMGGANLQSFYKAQLVWEQTMASRVLEFLATHPDGKLVVLLGRGHVDGGFGVPAYVHQKSDAPQLVLYPGKPPAERRPAVGTIARNRVTPGLPASPSLTSRVAALSSSDASARPN